MKSNKEERARKQHTENRLHPTERRALFAARKAKQRGTRQKSTIAILSKNNRKNIFHSIFLFRLRTPQKSSIQHRHCVPQQNTKRNMIRLRSMHFARRSGSTSLRVARSAALRNIGYHGNRTLRAPVPVRAFANKGGWNIGKGELLLSDCRESLASFWVVPV